MDHFNIWPTDTLYRDLHLETSTVREALRFSAVLRQPKTVSKQEKYDYVEEVIKMLNMSDFANAVVGVPGEGLNVEQRKLLTIGVELAAKPKLLLFLDEPTSGLDSQVRASESRFRVFLSFRALKELGSLSLLCYPQQDQSTNSLLSLHGPSFPSSAKYPLPAKPFSAPSINPAPSSSKNSTVSSSSPAAAKPYTSES